MDIKECFRNTKVVSTLQLFTMAQIVSYFIEAVANDNEQRKDFKSLRESSFHMFREGHIQKVFINSGYETLIIKSNCLPEMRKDRVYKIIMPLQEATGEIQFAKCECVAGKGPKGCCKHIASLCYALEDFSRRFLNEKEEINIACTDELQKWNQSRKKRLDPKKISELDFSLESYGKKKKTNNLKGRDVNDIIKNVTVKDTAAAKNLLSRLDVFQKQNPKEKLAILTVLNPSDPINKTTHISKETAALSNTDTHQQDLPQTKTLRGKRLLYKEKMNKSEQERLNIFHKTQAQTASDLWFIERRGRITGSICGRILNRNTNIYPASILKTMLSNNSNIQTAAMALGKEQERPILSRYTCSINVNMVTLKLLCPVQVFWLIRSVAGWEHHQILLLMMVLMVEAVPR